MKILLDECIDRRLARDLADHEVHTVPRMGWASSKNGELLGKAEAEFDAFVTVDHNMSDQQPVHRYDIAIFVLRSPSNRWHDLRPLVPELLRALARPEPGRVVWIGSA